VLLVFLDSVLTSQDQQAQRSVIDELLEDLTSIVCGLLRWAQLSENKDTKGLSVEDSALLLDVHAKALSAVELFVSTKGTKSSFREAVSPDNPSIEYVVAFIRYFSQCSLTPMCTVLCRYAVQALATTKEVISQLSLVRIIKSLVFTEAHLLKVVFDLVVHIAYVNYSDGFVARYSLCSFH
jgi:hypothetical protein